MKNNLQFDRNKKPRHYFGNYKLAAIFAIFDTSFSMDVVHILNCFACNKFAY